MDLAQNRIPENIERIHLIAVCGTGMGALAGMLKDAGFKITGSDQHVYEPMSTFLARQGIQVTNGFRPENLGYRPDLVVVGNAVSGDNPEVQAMFELALPFCSLPQALHRLFMHERGVLPVIGTHGKTTTSGLLAWILSTAGLDPGFMVGGILKNIGRNYNVGAGPYFVVEGDEYDTAFFDKGPKFLHYTPSRAILTSVEFDHADIYRDFEHVRQSFVSFVTSMPEEALLVACDESPTVRDLAGMAPCWTAMYGFGEQSPWRLEGLTFEPPWSRLVVTVRGEPYGVFRTRLIGRHNALNALAAIAVADDLRIPRDIISRALETFEGVKRRQEVRGIKRGVTVIDDFAHHPTEVKETLAAVRAFYRESRIVAVFEPRTNSSKRKVFQKVYPGSFEDADIICIRKPPLLEKIPIEERFSSEEMVTDLKDQGKKASYFNDTEAIIDHLLDLARPGDVFLIMSNGGFDNIHERLLEKL